MTAEQKQRLRMHMERATTMLRNNDYINAEVEIEAALEIVSGQAENDRLAKEMGFDK